MPDPLYRMIADDLKSKIDSGELAPGTQVPTEIELRDIYEASRNTIRDAIKWLITRGLVETRPGQGTFVVERIKPFVTTLTSSADEAENRVYIAEVKASNRAPDMTAPRVEIQRAERTVARALRIEEGSTVISRHQERMIDGLPWSLQTSFYPMSLVTRGADKLIQATDIEEGAMSYLAKACGIRQEGYRDTISVRAPNQQEALFFKLPSDGRVPLFDVYRVAYDQTGARVRLTRTVYPTDRNWLRIETGNVPPREGEDDPEPSPHPSPGGQSAPFG